MPVIRNSTVDSGPISCSGGASLGWGNLGRLPERRGTQDESWCRHQRKTKEKMFQAQRARGRRGKHLFRDPISETVCLEKRKRGEACTVLERGMWQVSNLSGLY